MSKDNNKKDFYRDVAVVVTGGVITAVLLALFTAATGLVPLM